MTTSKKLSCGGKGPCCHVGYSHRHCEHCDVVIATGGYVFPLPLTPYFPPLPYQPYRPWWGTTAGQLKGNDIRALRPGVFNAAAADSSYNVKSLPDPTVAHACEVTS